MYGVDVLVDTFWRIWTDLLDVLGIDGKCDAGHARVTSDVFRGTGRLQSVAYYFCLSVTQAIFLM